MVLFSAHGLALHTASTLSLHDALPISTRCQPWSCWDLCSKESGELRPVPANLSVICSHCLMQCARNLRSHRDRKSTRLNSSHPSTSYAVFCLKKKTNLNVLATHKRCPP